MLSFQKSVPKFAKDHPGEKIYVRFLDGNIENTHINNLVWVSEGEVR